MQTEEAISEFYVTERPKLIGFIKKMLRDSADRDAEDIIQEVMLSLFDRADVAESIENLGAYVYSSIRNKIIDLYRSKKKVNLSLEEIADSVTGYTLAEILSDSRYNTHNEIEKKEIINKIYSAVDHLKPNQKAVWIATEIEGHSFDELAFLWNTPIGTLLARKHRAVLVLRKLLKDLK